MSFLPLYSQYVTIYKQFIAIVFFYRSIKLKCDLCGKTPIYGHNVSHSKRRTNRDWAPNIQPHRLMFGGQMVRLNICSRCLRTYDKITRI